MNTIDKKPIWMRAIDALTLVVAVIALFSPFVALLGPAIIGQFSQTNVPPIVVSDVWIRPVAASLMEHDMPGMENFDATTAAYMTIANNTDTGDRLVRVETTLANDVSLHLTEVDENNVARMREQPNGIEIPARSVVMIEPVGYHVMLTDLTTAPEMGQAIPLILTFASGRSIEVNAIVSDRAPD